MKGARVVPIAITIIIIITIIISIVIITIMVWLPAAESQMSDEKELESSDERRRMFPLIKRHVAFIYSSFVMMIMRMMMRMMLRRRRRMVRLSNRNA